MIRLAETADALRPLCGSAFGCPILSAAAAYGFSRPFAQFWTDGAAAYGMLDGVMRIAGTVADPEEARAFLGAVGAAQVVCSAENGARLGLRVTARGAVLEKALSGAAASPAEPAPVRAVYGVLAANDMAGEFEPFTSISRTVCATARRARRCCMRAAKRSRRRWRLWPGKTRSLPR